MAVRRQRSSVKSEPLQITSLMDILTILLFYLLQNYSAEAPYNPNPDLRLPNSKSQQKLNPSVKIIASQKAISVEGTRVAVVCNGELYFPDVVCSPSGQPSDPNKRYGERFIKPLQDALKEKAELAKQLNALRQAQTPNEKKEFEGHIVLEAHFDLPYKILKSIMFTAGQSEFGLFKFAVKQIE